MNSSVEEYPCSALTGWIALPIWLAALVWAGWNAVGLPITHSGPPSIIAAFVIPILLLMAKGFTILEPNQGGVMLFFGRYAGTLREDGFFYVNPFYRCRKISLRAMNLNTPILKVNDRAGNPIEVAAVIVWRVTDTAHAVFDVENYHSYITMQSESAVRQVASARWYDGDANGDHSLRGDLDTVSRMLTETIQTHVGFAGLEVVEARISHLAYAQEIAGAMLRRQQATAVVAARQQIVEGAVGMVKMGLERLEADGIVRLNDAERVHLVTNLMTVLVADNQTQPVVSVGSSS
jgi:regulator of protease activity HflC (stomatin/prohibitin superfamily)